MKNEELKSCQSCNPGFIANQLIAILLTLLTHAALFIALGFFFARETPPPTPPETSLVISIEWSEEDGGEGTEGTNGIKGTEETDEPEEENETEDLQPDPEVEIVPDPEVEIVPEPIIETLPDPINEIPAEPIIETLPDPVDVPTVPSVPLVPSVPSAPPSVPSTPSPQPVVNQEPSAVFIEATLRPGARNVIRPVYPPNARRREEQGVVVHEITLSEKGLVTGAVLVESSGYPELDRAARRALMSARYIPATRDGVPVSSTLRQPIEFQLK